MSFVRAGLFFLVLVTTAHAEDLPPGAAGMKLTFSETFDGPLSWCSEFCSGEKWRTKYHHSGNSPLSRGLGMTGTESEVYMDTKYLGLDFSPFRIKHNTLTILAEPASGDVKTAIAKAYPVGWDEPKHVPKFTSGAITTEPSFSQLYGYFEARIKVSNVVGAWPAFWLYQNEGDEIDIMEVLGGRPTQQNMSVHWYLPGQKTQVPPPNGHGKKLDTVDLSADFHTYGMRWTAEKVTYYLDDKAVAEFPNEALRRPMYILLDLAMDGDWNKKLGYIAKPDAHAQIEIQFVKAYQ